MSKETDAKLPAGKFVCWAIPNRDEQTDVRPDVTADKDGFPQIGVRLAIAEKPRAGEEQPASFGERTEYQTIEPDAPARGGIETTPYEFAVRFLMALSGQTDEAVQLAMADALESPEKVLVLEGLGQTIAECEVVKRNGFTNVKVFTNRTVDSATASTAAERIRARIANKGAPGAAGEIKSPFAARGKPVAPPARQAPKRAPGGDDSFAFGANAPTGEGAQGIKPSGSFAAPPK